MTKLGHGIMQNYASLAQFRSDMVQIRSESEVTVTLSSSTMLDVLINPPYLMLELSEEEVKYNDFRRCHTTIQEKGFIGCDAFT